MFYRVRASIEGFQTRKAEIGRDVFLLDALNKGEYMGHVGIATGVLEFLVNLV